MEGDALHRAIPSRDDCRSDEPRRAFGTHDAGCSDAPCQVGSSCAAENGVPFHIAELIERLAAGEKLSAAEFRQLVEGHSPQAAALAAERAVAVRKEFYGNQVFVRGLIEVSSYCKNDCLYCGIRCSNREAARYRLSFSDIMECVHQGYDLGMRTFVLQGGEDRWFSDARVAEIVAAIKESHPDCAVTLSLGERSRESYQRLYDAGADRYLLRHETASAEHYAKLHPASMTLQNRMRCLQDLREIGYAVGVGFMVGSPYQTAADLGCDLAFVQDFQPEMCGIGPFVPHHATPFASFPAGSADLTCYLLSLIRLIKPNVLLPATTALGTVDAKGRERGILAGANVVMPNLSPVEVRKDYELYDNKICTGEEAAECRWCLHARMASIGYEVVMSRGDPA